MITVTQIRGGADYMGRHLSMNDYYCEEERVVGHWHGDGAALLGLQGLEVTRESFESLRANLHPDTGAKLRPRSAQVAFHDFVISAPKSVSIVAVAGQDERLVAAYEQCVKEAFLKLEARAAVRLRGGDLVRTEELKVTGNAVAAVFHHNTSRMLDPQLHSHLVFVNLSYDPTQRRWLALQPKLMAEASAASIRRDFYRDLESACRRLGYRTEQAGASFRLADLDPAMEHRLSQRSVQRLAFEQRYLELFAEAPNKKRIEHFIKDRRQAALRRFESEYRTHFGRPPSTETTARFVHDWRSDKMAESSASEVSRKQHERIGLQGRDQMKKLVSSARNRIEPDDTSHNASPEHTVDDIAPKQSQSKQRAQESQKVEPAKQGKSTAPHLSRQEVIRRYRRGMAVAAALRGHPGAIIRIQSKEQRRRHGS